MTTNQLQSIENTKSIIYQLMECMSDTGIVTVFETSKNISAFKKHLTQILETKITRADLLITISKMSSDESRDYLYIHEDLLTIAFICQAIVNYESLK